MISNSRPEDRTIAIGNIFPARAAGFVGAVANLQSERHVRSNHFPHCVGLSYSFLSQQIGCSPRNGLRVWLGRRLKLFRRNSGHVDRLATHPKACRRWMPIDPFTPSRERKPWAHIQERRGNRGKSVKWYIFLGIAWVIGEIFGVRPVVDDFVIVPLPNLGALRRSRNHELIRLNRLYLYRPRNSANVSATLGNFRRHNVTPYLAVRPSPSLERTVAEHCCCNQ